MPSTTEGLVNTRDYHDVAHSVLAAETWNYVEGGAGDEHGIGENENSWQRIKLWPKVLVDVSSIDTTIRLLDQELAHPILLAPTAAHALYHPEAELATLTGAQAGQALPVMSTLGSTPVDELGAATTQAWWLQLYVQPDRAFTADLVDRSVSAGASALVVTVDTPLLGARDRDRRLGGHTVDSLHPPNLAPAATRFPAHARPHERVYNPYLDPSLSWETLGWLVEISPVPVVAKGVLRTDDARRCVERGVQGVIVSNHGARNLDTTVSTATALPGIVDVLDGTVPVLVDGGIRRGTDVAKALSLGADAVLVGRPAIWGLAAAGAAGVTDVVDILRAELLMAMGLLGAPSIDHLTRDLISPS